MEINNKAIKKLNEVSMKCDTVSHKLKNGGKNIIFSSLLKYLTAFTIHIQLREIRFFTLYILIHGCLRGDKKSELSTFLP